MNKRPNSNLNGRLVPIFANNKKKRLKQALYANPSWDDCLNSSTNASSFDSYEEFPEDGNYFEPSEPTPQKQPFQQPQGKFGSRTNEGNFGFANDSNSSAPQYQYRSIRGQEESSSSSSRGSFSGSKRGGGQASRHIQAKGGNQLPRNTNDLVQRNKVTVGHGDNKSRISQYQTGRSVAQCSLNTNQQLMSNTNGNDSLNSNLEKVSSTAQQKQNFPKSKEMSSKQVNLMATPSDKSLKVITASIKDIQQWNPFRDKLAVIYEIFGTLNSQVSLNPSGNGKRFVIKDQTGSLGCTFWEMDRILPRLTRGQIHRCVGSLDRRDENFNCVSVRPVTMAELKEVTSLLEVSGLAMQGHLAALKED